MIGRAALGRQTDLPSTTVENRSRETIDPSVPQTCIAAGALLHDRDGHTVATSYGSVPGEIAVCMKSVGLADRSDFGALELRGDQNLLDRALIARLGDPAVAPGTGRRLRSVWYLRLDQRRALLVGPHAALASGPPIGKGRDRADLPHRDIGSTLAILSIIGPRAARLLGAAQLPSELAIGAVGRDARDAGVVGILRESQRRFLVLVQAPAADALWTRLLTAGKPLGAAFVGLDALTLLSASSGSNG
jgi:glycine cleavage system aminomethyltransferase T